MTMLSFLASCVTAYAPPSGGNTATLNVTVANSVGIGRLSIVPPGRGEKRILQNLDNPLGASTQTIVTADQSARLIYFESTGSAYCIMRVEFTPESGQIYNIYVGDRKPKADNGFFSSLAKGTLPDVGEQCVVGANQVLPDGSEKPIALTKWSML
jgi:hypothetical protein